jgi:hypothetical protein
MTTSILQPGTVVFTSDGAQLGTVAELRTDSFRIDVRAQPDYWLPLSSVEGTDDEGIHLLHSEHSVDGHRLDVEHDHL